jgi:hypothetical protein
LGRPIVPHRLDPAEARIRVTAINLVVQPERAILATDTAFYDPQGRLKHKASKVAIWEAGRMAFAVCGCVQAYRLADLANDPALNSQEDIMAALPAFARKVREENRRGAPDQERDRLNEIQIFVAMWRKKNDCAEGYILSSDQAFLGETYTPFSWAALLRVSTPPVPADLVDLVNFEPERDALPMLDHQRNDRSLDGASWVGGCAEVTVVDRRGISKSVIHDWGDRPGLLIGEAPTRCPA